MEAEVQRAKAEYNEALQNLEKISDEIHNQRGKMREDQKLLDFHEEVISISSSSLDLKFILPAVSGSGTA